MRHLEDVDVDVRHREHGSACQHAEQRRGGRLEPGHVDEQPVLRVETQRDQQHSPSDLQPTLSSELTCKTPVTRPR